MVCEVWLARDFLARAGRPLDIPPCDHPTAHCPPVKTEIKEPPMTTVSLGDDKPAFKLGPGLYYVGRGATPQVLYRLDGSHLPNVPRPDRDVLKALLRYAADGLDEQS